MPLRCHHLRMFLLTSHDELGINTEEMITASVIQHLHYFTRASHLVASVSGRNKWLFPKTIFCLDKERTVEKTKRERPTWHSTQRKSSESWANLGCRGGNKKRLSMSDFRVRRSVVGFSRAPLCAVGDHTSLFLGTIGLAPYHIVQL